MRRVVCPTCLWDDSLAGILDEVDWRLDCSSLPESKNRKDRVVSKVKDERQYAVVLYMKFAWFQYTFYDIDGHYLYDLSFPRLVCLANCYKIALLALPHIDQCELAIAKSCIKLQRRDDDYS